MQNQFVQWINVIDYFIIDILLSKLNETWLCVLLSFKSWMDHPLDNFPYLIRYDFTFVSILTKMFPGNIGKKPIYYTVLKCYNTFEGEFILENSIESCLQFHWTRIWYILFSLLESSPNILQDKLVSCAIAKAEWNFPDSGMVF